MQSKTRADIPWPEVVQRLKIENEKLERRPGGHSGEYFIVCTLYYTPKESGFTFERGFDATRVTKSGLHGRAYPRDFLRSVMKEGYGRIATPVNGRNHIRYNGGSYGFSAEPSGGGGTLVAHFSAAAGLPTIVLFGPETPKLYQPLGTSRAIYAGLACSPCVTAHNHRKTACTDNICMRAISVDEVYAAVAELLAAPRAAAAL